MDQALEQLLRIENFRKQLKIHFVGEEGVDEGGLLKEFFLLINEELFANRTLFPVLNDIYIWPARSLPETDMKYLWLAGVLLGLSIYNNVQLDVSFPIGFYKIMLLQNVSLWEIDMVMERSINNLLRDEIETNNNNEYFQVNIQELKLKKLNELLEPVEIIINGFQKVFPQEKQMPSFLYDCLRPPELEQLVRGKEGSKYCISILPTITTYQNGFAESSAVIQWLWQLVLKEFSDKEQANFIRFTTGSDRIPITGLENFVIYRCGPDADRLPTSQTCFNTLLLNEYASKEKMEKYLRMAISNTKGFGLC